MELDQEKLLEDAKKVVKEQAFFMRRALENASLREGLKHSSAMLSELKSSQLTPKSYYELFMKIFDELKLLEGYFKEEYRRGRKIVDLYESVQHATSLVPRLYLLVTVGSVYIQSHEPGSEKVLDDLIEMLKTVQNPLRGIFARYYFLKTCKERLPDKGNEYETESRTVRDAIAIILANLQETNRLWIRLQAGKDKLKLEKDRKDLRILVGENILRLSSLEGVSLEVYKGAVLPPLLELVESCKDEISQNFLLDCIIQSFPDEFHIETLQILVRSLAGSLEPGVDVKGILKNLLNRLSQFARKDEERMRELAASNVFEKLQSLVDHLVKSGDEDQLAILNLLCSFQQFTLKTYPDRSDYIDDILEKVIKACSAMPTTNADTQKLLVRVLSYPLESMPLQVLAMGQFPRLMTLLEPSRNKEVAINICKAISKLDSPLNTPHLVNQLMPFLRSLLDGEYSPQTLPAQIQKEQQAVARLVFCLGGQKTGDRLQLAGIFLRQFMKSSAQKQEHTLQAVYYLLQREVNKNDGSAEGRAVLEQMREIVGTLQKVSPQLSLKLYLSLALTINRLDSEGALDEFTSDLLKEVLLIYTEELTDNESKRLSLELIIASLCQLRCISADNYENLASECTKYCAKLLKKQDQVQFLLSACYLFLSPLANSPERVGEILEKVAKLCAGLAKEGPANLGSVTMLVRTRINFGSLVPVDKDKLGRDVTLGSELESRCEDRRLKLQWLQQFKQAYTLLQ